MMMCWRLVLVEMAMKVVLCYWWFEDVVVDGCDAWFRERKEIETENRELGVSGLSAWCDLRGERVQMRNKGVGKVT